jgi:hypothetical protein
MEQIGDQPIATPETEFSATLDRHLQAIAERDLAAFEATVSEEVRLVGTDGVVIEGRVNAVDAHQKWFDDGSWSFEPYVLFSDTKEHVGWALVRVLYRERETQQFLLFLLFSRDDVDGLWRLVYDQGTISKT